MLILLVNFSSPVDLRVNQGDGTVIYCYVILAEERRKRWFCPAVWRFWCLRAAVGTAACDRGYWGPTDKEYQVHRYQVLMQCSAVKCSAVRRARYFGKSELALTECYVVQHIILTPYG